MVTQSKPKGLDFELVTEFTPEVIHFMSVALGRHILPRDCTVLAFKDDKGIMGGWLFERYTGPGGSITMHWAGRDRRWLRYDMMVMCAHYVFYQLGCARALGEVPAKDTYVRKVDEKGGFRQVAVIPGYFPNDDLVIYELTRENCKFLPEFEEDDHWAAEKVEAQADLTAKT